MKLEKYAIYRNFINNLLKNQNDTNIPILQDILSYKDYDNLLHSVIDVINKNPNASITTLRYILFKESGLQELINNFIYQTSITPGIILDFGTEKTRDSILCGLSQEYLYKDNKKVYTPKDIELDTIFDLASTSKLFTAISILILNEQKLIDIFDPITKYVPEFKHLDNVTIYDLLKFRIKVITPKRVDDAKTKEEAENILFSIKPDENQTFINGYTDMGAMVLRYVVERASKISFKEFVSECILKPLNMSDTYLNVPLEKINRVANENYSTIINSDGTDTTKYDNVPGTPHDNKAIAIGELDGISPGHAGWFSTKDDMIKLANALINYKILSKDSVLSMSETATGFKDNDNYTYFYGSLVYLKQPDPNKLSVYYPLSGRSFMSPGFAGTSLVVDPINKLSLFIASPRLHNRIYQVHPNQKENIKIDEHNKKTFILPNGEEKVVCSDYTRSKEVMVTLALDLALRYQLLEQIYEPKEMHLIRELR